MIKTIYLEKAVADLPRSRSIIKKFPLAHIIEIDHYGEIFNRNNQSFRIQKSGPGLILAKKKNKKVLPVPKGLEIGEPSYYFSHMLNCLYDCRYCFLQGMFKSANYVVFVNYEDFHKEIVRTAEKDKGRAFFFSGYDCDSLAMEPITNFAKSFLPIFEKIQSSTLELRTKSTQIRSLLEIAPLNNVICSFSLNPHEIIELFEEKTPSLDSRINSIQKLNSAGWRIALRFDPIIATSNFKETYENFFRTIFKALAKENIDSISLGTFRLSTTQYKRMHKDRPNEWLYSTIAPNKSFDRFGYHSNLDTEILNWCEDRLFHYAEGVPLFRQSSS